VLGVQSPWHTVLLSQVVVPAGGRVTVIPRGGEASFAPGVGAGQSKKLPRVRGGWEGKSDTIRCHYTTARVHQPRSDCCGVDLQGCGQGRAAPLGPPVLAEDLFE